jgi:hypothetical protein
MELLKEQEEELEKNMQYMEQLYEKQPTRHETIFFRGKRGLKALFDDQLHQKQELLYLGATPAAVEQLKFYFPHFDRERVKRKIKVKLLFDQRAKDKKYIAKIPLGESRIATVTDPQDVVTCIYGDNVAIITFSEKPFGILIREAAVAKQYKNYFEMIWKK